MTPEVISFYLEAIIIIIWSRDIKELFHFQFTKTASSIWLGFETMVVVKNVLPRIRTN
jgi:hypothetical protein